MYEHYTSLDKEKYPDKADTLLHLIKEKQKNVKVLNSNTNPAKRSLRLWAAIIDISIEFVVYAPIFLIFYSIPDKISPDELINFSIKYLVLSYLIWQLVFIILHIYWLRKDGQTLGKKIMNIKIVTDDDNQIPSLIESYIIRHSVIKVFTSIPIIGWIASFIDVVFIFGKQRKCIHDYLAGTKVIGQK